MRVLQILHSLLNNGLLWCTHPPDLMTSELDNSVLGRILIGLDVG
jgi:hypothetical protein